MADTASKGSLRDLTARETEARLQQLARIDWTMVSAKTLVVLCHLGEPNMNDVSYKEIGRFWRKSEDWVSALVAEARDELKMLATT